MECSRVLGVVGGTTEAPEVAYINEYLPVSDEILAMTGLVEPTQVLRFAAPCQEKKCRHFDGKDCQLASRIVQILPAATDGLPACLIRATCRWYQQEGKAACLRCPQVVTYNADPSEKMRFAAEGKPA
jgi:hypothetical protein